MRGPTRKSPVKDARLSRRVIALCSVPPLSRDWRFTDELPERSSPDGAFSDPGADQPYPYDYLVANTLRIRAGSPKANKRGDNMRGRGDRMFTMSAYQIPGQVNGEFE
jgi:hypothetical protein